jgi:transcription termination/antitermination protein NusG
MSNNIKENDEDVTEVDDIFEDNQDNIDSTGETTINSPPPPPLGIPAKQKKKATSTASSLQVDNTNTDIDTSQSIVQEQQQHEQQEAKVAPASSSSDSKFYAIRTTGGQEHIVANILQNKINAKKIGIYSILLLDNFKGYIIVEAPDANVAFQALAGVRHIRGQIRGELPFKDIEGYLVKKPVVSDLTVDDTVEVIAGPFKAMKAKITRVDYEKQEATVVLLDSPYQIPVTVDANYLKKTTH